MSKLHSQKNSNEKPAKSTVPEKQKMLSKYIQEVEEMPLIALMRDPLVVNLPDDFAEAYLELENVKKIKKTFKKMRKITKIDTEMFSKIRKEDLCYTEILSYADDLTKPVIPFQKPLSPEYQAMFPLRDLPRQSEITKDTVMSIFRDHMKTIAAIPRHTVEQPTFSRNLSTSTSHSNYIKKIEKNETGTKDTPPQQPRTVNAITGSASFKNGVLKTMPSDEGSPNVLMPPSSMTIKKMGISSIFNQKPCEGIPESENSSFADKFQNSTSDGTFHDSHTSQNH